MKKTLRISFFFFHLTTIALFLWSCGEKSPKVKLEMKFSAGRELVYEQTNEQTVKVDTGETALETTSSHGEMIKKVAQLLSEGSALIRETTTWSWSEIDRDSAIRVVSSSESLTYTMAANGKISELDILSDGEAAKWKEYAESNLEQSQPTFPDEPVGKGYTWMQTVKIFLPTGENLNASTTYEVSDFVEVDHRKCVVIDYHGNLVLPFEVMVSDSLTQRGVDKVDVSGSLMFDYVNGYVFSQNEKTRITAERSKILPAQARNYSFYIEGDLFFRLKSVK